MHVGKITSSSTETSANDVDGVVLAEDAPVNSSCAAQQKPGWFCHPAFSPDLAHSNFHLFPKLKTFLAVQKLESNEAVLQETLQVSNNQAQIIT